MPQCSANSNLRRLFMRPSGQCRKTGRTYYSLINHTHEEVRHRQASVRPVLSHGVNGNAYHVNAQGARVHQSDTTVLSRWSCQPLLQIFRGSDTERCPHLQALLILAIPKSPYVCICISLATSPHRRDLTAKTRVCLNCRF